MLCWRMSAPSSSPSASRRFVPTDIASIPSMPLHPSQYVPDNFVATGGRPPVISPMPGFRVELGSDLKRRDITVELERQQENSPVYADIFLPEEHMNFISVDSPTEPVITSILTSGRRGTEVLALVRTRKRDFHVMIPHNKSRKVMLASIKAQVPDLSAINMKEVKEPGLRTDLQHLEDRLLHKHYKFGVIYCKEGQTADDEMFSNSSGSPEFEKFLDLIGNRVALKGYRGYDGELDVKTDTTGSHSVATTIDNFEVMFHVSTLLPFSTVNMQQIERKRHIGNDVVVIIFQDGDSTPFGPNSIASKFNHVYVVVQVVKSDPMMPSESPFSTVDPISKSPMDSGDPRVYREDKSVRYRVAAVSKSGVSPFGPLIPSNSIFYHGPQFRQYLLSKVVNAERASYGAPSFALYRTRRDWLKDVISKYS